MLLLLLLPLLIIYYYFQIFVYIFCAVHNSCRPAQQHGDSQTDNEMMWGVWLDGDSPVGQSPSGPDEAFPGPFGLKDKQTDNVRKVCDTFHTHTEEKQLSLWELDQY